MQIKNLYLKVKTTHKEFYFVKNSKLFLEPEQTKEISFIYLIRDYNQNLSHHKFKFEAYQLPFDYTTKGKNPKDILESCKRIDKNKILYSCFSLQVYMNYLESNLNISNKNPSLSGYSALSREDRNNKT